MPEATSCQEPTPRDWAVYWKAKSLAGTHRVFRRQSPLSVPPEWTAWLLMEKAGVSRAHISAMTGVDRKVLQARLRLATACMMFPPYAARIEGLRVQMSCLLLVARDGLTMRGAAACVERS